jgi:hypothetical protein
VWDFLIQQDNPVLSVKVCDQLSNLSAIFRNRKYNTIYLKICDESLTHLRAHEQGQLVAVANKNGSTYLLEFSEALTINQKNDKLLLTAVNIRLRKQISFNFIIYAIKKLCIRLIFV